MGSCPDTDTYKAPSKEMVREKLSDIPFLIGRSKGLERDS